MNRSFSYTLLITWVLISISCKTQFVQKSYETSNISVAEGNYTVDNKLVQMYMPFKNELDKDMKRVISFTERELKKDKPESLLTNFLADLLLEEACSIAETNELGFIPDLSYVNYGGIRTFIPEGEISVGKIYELMPFENELVYLQLTGSQIVEFLDVMASKGGSSLSGVRFVIKNEKAENVTLNGMEIEANEMYWLATNDYVAEGGDDMTILTERAKIIKSGSKVRELIIAHLEGLHEKGEKVDVKLDGRISNG